MESQQQTSLVLLASNISTKVSSQNKFKTPTSYSKISINHNSYNKQLVWNRVATHEAGRYKPSGSILTYEGRR